MARLSSVEICAGGGGTALGLEQAGFTHEVLVEIDRAACETLRANRPNWKIIEADVTLFDGHPFAGVDLLSGGVPCPPFSVAGIGLGADDERDLFPTMLRLVEEMKPRAVFIENVPGILRPVFDGYRQEINARLLSLGYTAEWKVLQGSDFGVPQLRPRVAVVALPHGVHSYFKWPKPDRDPPPTVGRALRDMMASRGWRGVDEWVMRADSIAPTLVGGSKRHGGPDLGPTRAKQAWAKMGVDALVLGNEPPGPDHVGMPRLTVAMAGILQGFPPDWTFHGGKTAAYRQVGNAFPPPVAKAVGRAIPAALRRHDKDVA